MARGLYRVYLYVVTILLLIFATVSTATLLADLLRLTSLRGSNGSGPPSGADLTQGIVLMIVTVIIVAALGGLHYWLIRRDMASDPKPGASSVRSFMLNLAIGVATLVATIAGASALSSFDLAFDNDLSGSLSAALATLALALALEWERRRATPTGGAALVFQRLRVDGLGLILVLTLVSFLYEAVSYTETLIGQASGILQCTTMPPDQYYGPYNGAYVPQCVGSQLIGQWAAAALVIIVWLLYLRADRRDRPSLIRPVFLLLGYAAGIIALIVGLQRIVEYLLRLISAQGGGQPDYLNNFDAAPLFVYAALTLLVYLWCLRQPTANALDAPTARLTTRAIGAAIFAGPFWVGVAMLLNDAFITLIPGGPSDPTNWPTALAVAIAGLPYIPLALWLGAGVRAEGVRGPRRGFVLALLAAGALVTAGGAATLIYSVLTATLGVPLNDWQGVARQAGAALIVGLALGLLYLVIAIREGQFARAPRPEAPEAPETPAATAASGAALDDVLTQFQQGGLTQAEAAQRIRELAQAGALTP